MFEGKDYVEKKGEVKGEEVGGVEYERWWLEGGEEFGEGGDVYG